jgi:hypothetical protein
VSFFFFFIVCTCFFSDLLVTKGESINKSIQKRINKIKVVHYPTMQK